MCKNVIRRYPKARRSGRITILTMILIVTASCHSVSAISSGVLGDDIGIVISVEPTVNQTIVNNNYNISGGNIPQAPWLSNSSGNLYFNDTLMNATCDARDDDTTYQCSDWSGCTDLTTTYNASYDATSQDVTANRTSWLEVCYNSTYESTYNATYDAKPDTTFNASYHATGEDVTANRTTWETDTDTTYTENSPYLNLAGTVFTLVESVLNATIGNIVEGYGYITSAFNQSYHDTWLDVQANRTQWATDTDTQYNASYHATTEDVTANRTTWESTYNATYDAKQNDVGSNCGAGDYAYGIQDDGTVLCREDVTGGEGASFNSTYHATTLDVEENRSAWFSTYNSTYDATSQDVTANRTSWLSTYNATYDSNVDTNCTADTSCATILYSSQEGDLNVNSSGFWDNLDSPLAAWITTFNATYDAYVDTDTFNTTEEMQDACGAMMTGTETRISVTYQDASDDIDFIVDDMTSTQNDTYDITTADVDGNRTSWFSTYNLTYHTTTLDADANRTTWENQTANAVECGSACIADAEVDDTITINSAAMVNTSANISTTNYMLIIQDQRICLDGVTCSKYLTYNGSHILIQG